MSNQLPVVTTREQAALAFSEKWLVQQITNINAFPQSGSEYYDVSVQDDSIVPIDQLIKLVGSERTVIDRRENGVGNVRFILKEGV